MRACRTTRRNPPPPRGQAGGSRGQQPERVRVETTLGEQTRREEVVHLHAALRRHVAHAARAAHELRVEGERRRRARAESADGNGLRARRCVVLAFLGAVTLATTWPSPGSARSLESVRFRGTIGICAHPNALPYSHKNGEPPGFQIELGRASLVPGNHRLGLVHRRPTGCSRQLYERRERAAIGMIVWSAAGQLTAGDCVPTLGAIKADNRGRHAGLPRPSPVRSLTLGQAPIGTDPGMISIPGRDLRRYR